MHLCLFGEKGRDLDPQDPSTCASEIKQDPVALLAQATLSQAIFLFNFIRMIVSALLFLRQLSKSFYLNCFTS